jgi:hypothetical protein
MTSTGGRRGAFFRMENQSSVPRDGNRSASGNATLTDGRRQLGTMKSIFRFHLRTLLVATLAVACLFAYTTSRYRRMHNAHIAIGAVGEMLASTTESTPLIRELVGDDRYFQNIACVNLGPDRAGSTNVAISDQDLANLIPHMNAFSKFHALRLRNTRVTDDGLAQLARLERLQSLHLGSSIITDAGISKLKSVSTLNYLFVGCNKVTDRELEDLQSSLPHLQIQRGPEQFHWGRTKRRTRRPRKSDG